jgi:hypothetical protein
MAMSDQELIGALVLQNKAAKDTLAKRKSEALQWANVFQSLAGYLRAGALPASIETVAKSLPTLEEVEAIFHDIAQAKAEAANTKDQLTQLGITLE